MNHNYASHRIRCISIIGGFLDGTKFELADGLNCFIGARGAGKTTMLEFVRYALDALPEREDHHPQRRTWLSVQRTDCDGRRTFSRAWVRRIRRFPIESSGTHFDDPSGWPEAAIDQHRNGTRLQSQNRQAGTRPTPIRRPHRIHRPQQNRHLSAS